MALAQHAPSTIIVDHINSSTALGKREHPAQQPDALAKKRAAVAGVACNVKRRASHGVRHSKVETHTLKGLCGSEVIRIARPAHESAVVFGHFEVG